MSAAPTPPPADGSLAVLPEPLRALAEHGVERRYRKGAIFIQEGEPGGPMYFIVSGRARAFTARDDGREFTFGRHGPGSYLGELSLDGGPRSASVIAETAVVCRMVTRHTLEQCIARDPALAMLLLTNLTRRVRELSVRARNLALEDAKARLWKFLCDTGLPQPDGSLWLPEPLTQGEIGEQVGCARAMVTRIVGGLVAAGSLRLDGGRWRVLLRPPPVY